MTPDILDALQAEADRLGYHLTHTKDFIAGVQYVLMIRLDHSIAFVLTMPMEPVHFTEAIEPADSKRISGIKNTVSDRS